MFLIAILRTYQIHVAQGDIMDQATYSDEANATFKEQVAQTAGWMHSKYRVGDVFKNARYETASQFYLTNNKKSRIPERMTVHREA